MNDAAAILQAARDGDAPAVEHLLSGDPRLVRASDEYLKTPLHWAAEHDRRDVAEMLLDAGADLEATTSWDATALPDAKADHLEAFERACGEVQLGVGELPNGVALVVRLNLDCHVCRSHLSLLDPAFCGLFASRETQTRL